MGEAAKGFSSAPASGLPLPRLLGRRILLRLVARGGMGDVYLGATTGIEGAERPCIVKTVRRDHIHDGSFLARFLDEARVQAQLQHPGVAQVLEAATDDQGEPFTVVEYVEGRSLSDVRQRAVQLGVRVGWAEAVGIAIEVAQALAHVHDRSGPDGSPLGIVHRDLSPQNVMVGYTGEVKLIDFGTARGHNRRCHTVAGVVFAKPGYVAPEVARQQVGDGRIDLYALGIMLWEVCAGRRFLTIDPQQHLDDAAAGRVIVPPIANACGAPRELDEVIARLTKNDPDERYARASLAVLDLARLLAAAPAAESGERGVRARIALLMHELWGNEPGRSRAEFARLLREARSALEDSSRASATPDAGPVSEAIAQRMTPDDPSVLAGTPYRLVRKLGEGATGVVWEAEHVELGRRLAIKVLAPEHASAPAALERFRREARAVAKLSHPNLVQILDFGKSLDGRVYFAMELCVGETLGERLRRGPLAWRDAVRIALQASRALAAAHAAGLVHRDLKPENLMLVGEAVKLLDFGVAVAIADDGAAGPWRPSTTKERILGGFAIFGTPEYMAPEQVSGEAIDGRTDIYALGCVLYEMVTGEAAFDGASSVVVMGKQLRETPAPPRVRSPALAIPVEVEAIVMRAMAKHPGERFPSAEAMQQALEQTLAIPERRTVRARRALTATLMSLAVAVAAGGSAYWARLAAPRLTPTLASAIPPAPAPTASALLVMAAPMPSVSPPPDRSPPPQLGSLAGEISPQDVGHEEPVRPLRTGSDLREARAAAKARPGDPHALEAWARAAYHAGELREARRAASVWTLHDGTVEPRLLMAQVLAASGKHADAVATLGEWLESHPDSTDARSELARLSHGQGHEREAREPAAAAGAPPEPLPRELARR
jgi:serine/threonine-protein kinase